MKPLIEWKPEGIFALSWLPALALALLSFIEPYDSPDRFTFSLLGEIWYMVGYAIYMASVALTLSKKLTADRQKAAFADSLWFVVVNVLLPILALLCRYRAGLLPALPLRYPLILLVVSLLCFLSPAYFTAKYLTTVEFGRPTSFRENLSTCLALSFFPLSVFFIQSRVQAAIYADAKGDDSFE